MSLREKKLGWLLELRVSIVSSKRTAVFGLLHTKATQSVCTEGGREGERGSWARERIKAKKHSKSDKN